MTASFVLYYRKRDTHPDCRHQFGRVFCFRSVMKDINKLKDYRKKYKRYYNIEFSKDYVVHHIDFDRSNNDISNLVLLPRKLHSKYHFCLSCIRHESGESGPVFLMDGRINSTNYLCWRLSLLKDFTDVLEECSRWYDYKCHLDGLMPNVHNIALD